MRVWLDDIRKMPDTFDVHVKTAQEAVDIIATGKVSYISLDHDLGPVEAGSGYDVACFIEMSAHIGDIDPIEWNIHSANPVGIKNMTTALINADRYWSNRSSM